MCQSANKIIKSTFAATIMKIGYGIAVQESDDPYISIAEEVLSGIADAGIPGAFWVDFFPVQEQLVRVHFFLFFESL